MEQEKVRGLQEHVLPRAMKKKREGGGEAEETEQETVEQYISAHAV